MRYLLFGIKYLAQHWILGKDKPLICGLVLHNKCNLKCKHCSIVDRDTAHMSYHETMKVIDNFYSKGGRCLYLEGGEPFIWKDHNHNMEDVVFYAQKKGYYAVIIYTNGMQTLESKADTIFVSIDGLEKTHDYLRGKSFDKILENIKNSNHSSLYINYTINSANKDDISHFCKYIEKVPQINGTFFYFHTPYYGYDELNLDSNTKKEILYQLIELKKKYSILNSYGGLKSAIRNDWKRNLNICQVYESGKYYKCCRENNNGKTCIECGYLSYAEIDQTIKLNPGAIINAIKYF